jgi:type IV pilus assembly protein PilW
MMKRYHFKYRQDGMTLTELMVAVAIGLVLSTAIMGLFLQTSSSNNQNNEIGYLQDNGRYALKALSDDLEMSNFWAGMSASDSGSIRFDDNNVAQDGGNPTIIASINFDVNLLCGDAKATTNPGENWNYNFNQPLSYLDTAKIADAQAAFPCITNVPIFIDDTDVLMISRTRGEQLAASQKLGRPYIRGNRSVATLHKYDAGVGTKAPPTGYFDWQYLNHIYYIAKDCAACDEPKLYRQALKEAGILPSTSNPSTDDPEFTTEEIAAGIERFNIEFGIDNNSDGVADFFSAAPSDADILNAVVAKIYLLARSQNEVQGYKNTKVYQLGNVAVDPNPDDGYYRRVFSTTVSMKNTQAVLAM